MSLLKKSLCIVYHSPYGHTAKVASYIAQGAKTLAIDVHLMSIEHIDWDALDAAHGIIFGSPTYMGSVSADLKSLWIVHLSVGKIVSGKANLPLALQILVV
jgi:NAD(P)H dehydrogenase (quinone)